MRGRGLEGGLRDGEGIREMQDKLLCGDNESGHTAGEVQACIGPPKLKPHPSATNVGAPQLRASLAPRACITRIGTPKRLVWTGRISSVLLDVEHFAKGGCGSALTRKEMICATRRSICHRPSDQTKTLYFVNSIVRLSTQHL